MTGELRSSLEHPSWSQVDQSNHRARSRHIAARETRPHAMILVSNRRHAAALSARYHGCAPAARVPERHRFLARSLHEESRPWGGVHRRTYPIATRALGGHRTAQEAT